MGNQNKRLSGIGNGAQHQNERKRFQAMKKKIRTTCTAEEQFAVHIEVCIEKERERKKLQVGKIRIEEELIISTGKENSL